MTMEELATVMRYCFFLGLYELGGWYVSCMNEVENGGSQLSFAKEMAYIDINAAISTYRLISRSIIGVSIGRFIILRYVLIK